MRILLAEDEVSLSRAIVKILEKKNYTVDAAFNGEDALFNAENFEYDIIILDVMMPKMDGFEVLKRLREKKIDTPVLILSARSEVDDKVQGLDLGANDYLGKPFDVRELLARLRALTRSSETLDNVLTLGNTSLNLNSCEIFSPYNSFKLANKEFQLMELFMSNPKKMYSPDKLLDKFWSFDSNADVTVIWTYISYLRKKLMTLNSTLSIKSSRNQGYYLEENDK